MQIHSDISAYIAAQPKHIQLLLKQMRVTIRKAAPRATEAMKYGMPTFVGNKNLVHFAAFKKHIGFFPTPSGVREFKRLSSNFKTSKGAVQFPLDKPLPLALVTKIVKFRLKEDSVRPNER